MTSKTINNDYSASRRSAGTVADRPWQPSYLFLFLAALLLWAGIGVANAHAGTICRVTTAGASYNSGADWAHPLDAVTALQSYACDEVWVAQGVYTATAYPFTFKLRAGAHVYGGFAGNESSRGQRDWIAHLTVLSGDKDSNDSNTDGNGIAESFQDIKGNNSQNVLRLEATPGSQISSSTVLDGFTITAGDGQSINGFGGGLICYGVGNGNRCSPTLSNLVFAGNASAYGGALYLNGGQGGESSPQISHVIFSGNYAEQQGGAVFANGASGGLASPILTDVAFYNNSSDYYGGAMYSDAHGSGHSNPSLTDVTFDGNDAYYQGGAMMNFGYGGESSPTLLNVTFSNNTAAVGGAMYNSGTKDTSAVPGKSHPTLRNVTFSDNHANSKGGAICNWAESGGDSDLTLTNVTFNGNTAMYGGAMYSTAYASGYAKARLTNVILWGNTASSSGPDIYIKDTQYATTDLNIDYSVVEGGDTGIAYETGIPSKAYLYGGFNTLDDPELGALADNGGLTQTMIPGSNGSAVGAGICAGAPTTDQRGVARPTGADCDIGAVEAQAEGIFANGFE